MSAPVSGSRTGHRRGRTATVPAHRATARQRRQFYAACALLAALREACESVQASGESPDKVGGRTAPFAPLRGGERRH
jgi:hypothetical protein